MPSRRRTRTTSATGASISERRALLRGVPDSFANALSSGGGPLDPAVARLQHAGYRRALEGAGFTTELIRADEAHPDSPFVEDTAVIVGPTAVVTRPGEPSRRGEVAPVAAVLASRFPVVEVGSDATLDGGDVLVVGDRVVVGLSKRTDIAGARVVTEVAERHGFRAGVVDVRGALHLQTAVTALDDDTVIGDFTSLDPAPFEGLRRLEVPAGEEQAANVVALGEGGVLLPAGFPRTAELLAAAGYQPVTVDVSEFAKADGGLTCLSIRW